ncbi:prolyl oligopeptidase family serine peptidase [Falsibacillus pallidus]|uniref:S9 family peptidase n=1 Tax=Falsibacillus pallidus TaxID=493781 RepID=UPI003D974836
MERKNGITPEDLYELKSAADPNVSPDGTRLLYIQTHIDKEKKEYVSNLYHLDLQTKASHQWTYGKDRVSTPRWSPDGKKAAFVSNRSGLNQIYVIPLSGGEALQVTKCKNGASNPVWSPCGKKLAFTVSLEESETLEQEPSKEEEKKELKPLEVERMKYKSDAQGFLNDRKNYIAVVDLETFELRQLTSGSHDTQLQSWSPDGKYIAYACDEADDKDFSFQNDVFLYEVESGKANKVTEGEGVYWQATWSPDGSYLSFIGHLQEFRNATHPKIWLYHLKEGELFCFSEAFDAPIGDLMVGDFHQGAASPGVQWTEDNEGFYFLATDNGNTVIYYGNVSGEIYPSVIENQHIYGFSLAPGKHHGVAAISTPTMPGELFAVSLDQGGVEQLTNVNGGALANKELVQAEVFEFEGADGWKVQGWIMKPTGFEEGKKYPMVLEIHGGPHAMYGNTYMNEFQILAAQGYAVLFVNPRGSHGYGQDFVDAVRGDYGGNDYNDIMHGVDHALKTFDFIDEKRLGVTGGSYGGFMTNWIVGHTDRFKAAVTQRCISNWISFYGVSDIGYYFSEWQIGADLNDIEKLWKHSPIAYVNQIKTPLLIIHSEKDYRCPIEQSEQLFIALKRQKKETKFIRFPESNHELSRSGKPALRMKRLEYIRDWFKDYL